MWRMDRNQTSEITCEPGTSRTHSGLMEIQTGPERMMSIMDVEFTLRLTLNPYVYKRLWCLQTNVYKKSMDWTSPKNGNKRSRSLLHREYHTDRQTFKKRFRFDQNILSVLFRFFFLLFFLCTRFRVLGATLPLKILAKTWKKHNNQKSVQST